MTLPCRCWVMRSLTRSGRTPPAIWLNSNFQITCPPTCTNTAVNARDYGRPRWQLCGKNTPNCRWAQKEIPAPMLGQAVDGAGRDRGEGRANHSERALSNCQRPSLPAIPPRRTVAEACPLRTSTRTSESPCARASCGDVTRGGGIPDVTIRHYAGRHDRHACDSRTLGYRRLEAR
jgi:hypothetical protein